MSIRVSNSDKKAEIARDVVVAYLSHVEPAQLSDLDQVSGAIGRLIEVVDASFDVPDKPHPGFGISPTLPRPTA